MKQFSAALLLAVIFPFSSSEDPCTLTNGPGFAEQSAALKIVNDARAKLANGEQQNGRTGTKFPKGNIGPLMWSCDLEQQASDLLGGSCPDTEPSAPDGRTVLFTNGDAEPQYYLTEVMECQWIYNIESIESDAGIGVEDVEFPTNPDLREYANLVRESTTEIGCAQVICKGDYKTASLCLTNKGCEKMDENAATCLTKEGDLVMVAFSDETYTFKCNLKPNSKSAFDICCALFRKRELSLGDVVYHILGTTTTTTTTTTTATTSTTTTATTSTTTAITTPPETTTTTTTPTTTTTAPAATTTAAASTTTESATKGTTSCIPRRKAITMAASSTPPQELPGLLPAGGGPNERCPENTGMHDTLRTKFLDMHNYRRSQLAKGDVAKRNGNYLPQSSDMQRMRYNCALEKEVIDYVSTCPSSKSAESARPDVGENFIRVPQEGLATYLTAVEKAVTSWWKVIRTEEGPGLQVYFRQKHVGTPIESFTQMGWSTSRKLGCAIAKCDSDYVAICRYSPRGNYVEQVIYKRGTPCTACAVGSWCTEDSLCTLE